MLHHLEGFLVKVVREHSARLADDDLLRKDVLFFCRQEGWHSRLHTQFNKKLMREGYPWIGPDADKMKVDFEGLTTKKSPRFCLAYAEGFETFGQPRADRHSLASVLIIAVAVCKILLVGHYFMD